MLNDLAALAPPLVMCAAFVIGVAAFIRHEMRRGSREDTPEGPARISGRSAIATAAREPTDGTRDDGAAKDPGSSG
jgi:hypothetical protein